MLPAKLLIIPYPVIKRPAVQKLPITRMTCQSSHRLLNVNSITSSHHQQPQPKQQQHDNGHRQGLRGNHEATVEGVISAAQHATSPP
eukprot:CAMPEP_0119113104 /NCGR_PEP_ID=MMETSP1180-20130426/42826_1 /TAXON_ID=3052 ORGANISM="Chlamydomonas cf sp, Strain CCMP681" /NCGR_SAMPLE_ID=MMETSP1180 /ASSEMBLY_ACC=CAM_ASM_000741 /LENGTH=86 /DNA_ID=CAMNT_0007100967 /DNA_START=97 /DNA_END=354 /DNA_ORIENTATION=+